MPSVYLSPSTQDKNVGAGNYGTEENVMQGIGGIVELNLVQHGIEVFRNKPTMTLNDVVRDSNGKKADIHVAIHSNAGNKEARGAEIWCYMKDHAITKSQVLAQFIYDELEPITPTSDRGIKNGVITKLAEVVKIASPSIIIEIDFHDTLGGAEFIMHNKENIAEAITKGILKYFGIPYKPKVKPPEKKRYTVQLGVFENKEAARKLMYELIAKGYKAFIKEESI